MKFGWAETNITPKEKISLAGEFFERVTNEVETPITMTALAIEENGEQTVICSCDVIAVSFELTQEIRKRIGNIGLNTENIILCAPHIHNSYEYRRKGPFPNGKSTTTGLIKECIPDDCTYIQEYSNEKPMSQDDAFEVLANAGAKTVTEAWKNLKEGGYSTGFGRAAVGMNRRVCYSDGTAKMWGDSDTATFTELEGGNDNGVEMLFTYDENKKLTGVVANVACPAQVMEQRTIISSDYWGKLKLLLREKYGNHIFLLPLCAPAGDQCPRDLIRWVEPETPIKDPNVIRNNPKMRDADPSMFDIKGTWKIGKRIFNEIDSELDEVDTIHTSAVHKHTVKKILLPLRKVTDAEIADAKSKMQEFFNNRKVLNYMDSASLYVYAGTVVRGEIQELYNTIEIELHTVRLGDIVFSTSPFELFLDFGNRVRARSAARQTFLIQLANGSLSYLPTEKAEKHGHYSAYVSSGFVGHEGGEMLVNAGIDAISELFD